MKKQKNNERISLLTAADIVRIDNEGERTVQYLNEQLRKGDPLEDPEEDYCEDGEHYVLINDFGQPQCEDCLQLYQNWKAVRLQIQGNYAGLGSEYVDERIRQLKKVARQVKSDQPPENELDVTWQRYLTGFGYQYMHRVFYDYDPE